MVSDSAIHSLAGAAGGIVAMSATYPLIVLSTRAAVNVKNDSKNVAQHFLEIVKREGVVGLYSGLSPSLLGIAVTNGVYYYFYERSRGIILNSRQGSKALNMMESMLAGVVAGSATTIISNPIWVIQTSQAVRVEPSPSELSNSHAVPKRPSILRTIQAIIAKDGLNGLFRGLGPALVLVINPVLQYTVFEQLKNFLIKKRTLKLRARGSGSVVAVLSDWDFFVLGAFSKLVATGSTYPYIVLKSRLQAGQARAEQYKSSLHGLATILKEEGIQGLYKGVGSKLLQSVFAAAILFAVQRRIYELTKKAITSLS
ncbi:peroxisomal membrane protein PMP47B [Suillus fuscotomentosus]|uniref:Peroxisomal membrane protein PMP47B n=1 Tax=Suillus fuscotomentosus TaxID=1912939 RepID=A0AAD4HSC6_9AGAM|nr:peroxisomal membrane protein PMP47B [Suillus fuscotomentosus]KAG1907228.1 peroxisomal membrane protein PMP47B [Suillus fuscotomentosus]